MKNILLKLKYNGAAYHGWQIQPRVLSLQAVVQKGLSSITKERVEVFGCSRTDSGVHANEFILNFHTACTIPCERIPAALNGCTPDDLVCVDAKEVAENFHARYDCVGKEYVYQVLHTKYREPMLHNRAYHYPYKLDVLKMKEAAACIRGKRDYAAFKAQGNPVTTTVRTIYQVTVEEKGDFIEIKVSGDGFLYNMVRIIVGTLLLIGREKLTLTQMELGLALKDRTMEGPTAPAYGLYLNEVYYDDCLGLNSNRHNV